MELARSRRNWNIGAGWSLVVAGEAHIPNTWGNKHLVTPPARRRFALPRRRSPPARTPRGPGIVAFRRSRGPQLTRNATEPVAEGVRSLGGASAHLMDAPSRPRTASTQRHPWTGPHERYG